LGYSGYQVIPVTILAFSGAYLVCFGIDDAGLLLKPEIAAGDTFLAQKGLVFP
jgi:hypothetical protein